MTPIDLLKAARVLIAVPETWVQGACARDSQGMGVSSTSLRAVAWCAAGALIKANLMEMGSLDVRQGAITALSDEAGLWVVDFNDTHTHADVLDLFDRAISRLEQA